MASQWLWATPGCQQKRIRFISVTQGPHPSTYWAFLPTIEVWVGWPFGDSALRQHLVSSVSCTTCLNTAVGDLPAVRKPDLPRGVDDCSSVGRQSGDTYAGVSGLVLKVGKLEVSDLATLRRIREQVRQLTDH